MSIKGYKGSLYEVSKDLTGFRNKCLDQHIFNKLTELEQVEENFNIFNSNNIKYYYDKEHDSLFKVEVESFQSSYCLNTTEVDSKIIFTSIFDNAGSSLEQEIKKIIKKKYDWNKYIYNSLFDNISC